MSSQALLIGPVVLPLAAGLAAYLAPAAFRWIAAIMVPALVAAVVGLGRRVVADGAQRAALGGWSADPGIALRADALAVLFLGVTALVMAATTVYAMGYWPGRHQSGSARTAFWPLWWLLWTGLNAVLLTGDAFNAYVGLELMGLASVALVALARTPTAYRAALRYLLVSLLASLAYLAGVALLYGRYATLDMAAIAAQASPEPATAAALALISAGLLLKTALFPLHFWLPAAHGNAPGPVSAVLSALVVKAGFYLLLRYWFGVLEGAAVPAAYTLVGFFGAAAVVWGGFQALAAPRLKLLVAYSTVAQLGYLFLAFPALAAASGTLVREGVLYLALAHALAKAAAFLAAGTVLWAAGTDRMGELPGILRRLPVTAAALAIAGVSLIGMPPTGGFAGKWALLGGLAGQARWGAVVVLLMGSLLTAGYIFRVLVQVFHNEAPDRELERCPGIAMEGAALVLALAAVGMGFAAPLLEPLVLVEVGP